MKDVFMIGSILLAGLCGFWFAGLADRFLAKYIKEDGEKEDDDRQQYPG